jgi:Putative zinc-finger
MKSDCQRIRDQVADFISGTLCETDEQAIRKHLDTCTDCRRYVQALKQEDALLVDHFAQIDADMAIRQARVLGAVESAHTTKQTDTPVIWRRIMENRLSKIAAAVAIVALGIGMYHLTGSFDGATAAYGMGDVPGLFRRAKVIHLQGWLHWNLTDRGKKVPKMPVERWIDQENSRFRITQTTVYADDRRVTFTEREIIVNGEYKMVLNHTAKDAFYYRMGDYQRMLETYYRVQDVFGRLFGNIEHFQNFTKTGQEEIGGVAYDIWECEVRDPGTSHTSRYKYWLSPQTGQSGRFRTWYKNGNEPWRLGHDYEKIERDVPVEENLFALEVPEGYEARNTKETAELLELNEQGYTGSGSLVLDPYIGFALSGGSVILGWRSADQESGTSQEALFEELEWGGALPRLPIEVYALRPSGWTGDTTYQGRHLAYTRQGDKWIEWSLYVPDGPAPGRDEMLGYDLLCRFHVPREVGSWPSTDVDCGIPVETSEDFETWVVGAMAELSDDGVAPEHVTYENVMELAREIRLAMNP